MVRKTIHGMPAQDRDMPQDFASPNVLFSTNTPLGYIPPVALSINQVVCGPHWETQFISDRYVSIKTPRTYDIGRIVAMLPASQKPDLVIVRTDVTMVNVPTNLASIRCPKVLFYGDTHHKKDPIRTALAYLDSEKFDHVIIGYDKHHVHWFREAGHDNVHFIPGLDVRHTPVDFVEDRTKRIIFVGQFGKLHVRRKWYLDQITVHDYPLEVKSATRDESARLFAESQISFNCSLNGDLNMRVFEVLGAGGFLLTDKLSRQAGMEQLFTDGEHLVCYQSRDDLFAKLDHYLAHPDEALAIARQGHAEYLRRHRPEQRIDAVLRLAFHGERPVYSHFSDDPRAMSAPSQAHTGLLARMALYEFFQELQRQQEAVNVLCCGGTSLACDLADLPRVILYFLEDGVFTDNDRETLKRAGVEKQIQTIGPDQAHAREWDALMLGAEQLDPWLERLMDGYRAKHLAVDGIEPIAWSRLVGRLSPRGWSMIRSGLTVFVKVVSHQAHTIGNAEGAAIDDNDTRPSTPPIPWKWS